MTIRHLRFGGPGSPRATLARIGVLAMAATLTAGCSPGETEGSSPPVAADLRAEPTTPLAPIRVSGSYWIELSPVLVAANTFYPAQMPVGQGGIVRITAGETDLATNAETQLLRETVEAVLPRVTCPALAIHGVNDEYGSVRHAELIGRLVGGPVRIEILQDTGHVPQRERPELVLGLVREFLASVPAH